MLNEFLMLERGMAGAGLAGKVRHRDVERPGKMETLLVRLDRKGVVSALERLDAQEVSGLWTMKKGNHHSFPFLQIKKPPSKKRDGTMDNGKRPILAIPNDERPDQSKMTPGDSRRALRDLASRFGLAGWVRSWPGDGFKENLREREALMALLDGTDAAAVPAAINRFLTACEAPCTLFRSVVDVLLDEVDEGDDRLLKFAWRLLIEDGGALYVDVTRDNFPRVVTDWHDDDPFSHALDIGKAPSAAAGMCAISGERTNLADKFPRVNLGQLGRSFIFAKNQDIPAAFRYGRAAADAFPIGELVAQRLSAAVEQLASPSREGKTCRLIPGEKAKQNDLLLAFVDAVPEAEIVSMLGTDDEDGESVDPEAAFEKRTSQVIEAVKAKVQNDFRSTLVRICILRNVDTGNCKAIYQREIAIGRLYDMASRWIEGEGNLPSWLRLPVFGKQKTKVQWRRPVHVAPLQVPGLTRLRYIRGGVECIEAVGLSAREAFALFLEDRGVRHQAATVLRSVLRNYEPLLLGHTQALRKGRPHAQTQQELLSKSRAGVRYLALQGLTLIGVLIHKAGRQEEYMEDTAFRLGQLLAVADTVHVGYCMDKRNGDVPPTLLGNAVFAMAQKNPTQALALLCRRWAPYAAWARQPDVANKARTPIGTTDSKQTEHEWAIRNGYFQALRAKGLTLSLHGHLPSETNDLFRAELLLGYVAGLPRQGSDNGSATENYKGE